MTLRGSLTYPDLIYLDFSLIRTHHLEQIQIIYIESDSLIRIFSYLDSNIGRLPLGNPNDDIF